MSHVQRWRFEDPYDTNPSTATWTVPINPNTMTSPFPRRPIQAMGTTAVDGQVLLFEGNTQPVEWTFGGVILDVDHYERLRSWVYDRRRRIRIYDHFGRRLDCVLTEFRPTPRAAPRRYWKHDYEITGLVFKVGVPTVFEQHV